MVKIVFIDQLGCFASIVVAAMCRGVLSADINYRDLLNLPYFAAGENYQPGQLYYVGKDQRGNEFYTLAVGCHGDFITTVIWPEMLKISQGEEKIFLYDVSSFNSALLNLGEVLSKGKLRKISKYLWAYWFIRIKNSLKQEFC